MRLVVVVVVVVVADMRCVEFLLGRAVQCSLVLAITARLALGRLRRKDLSNTRPRVPPPNAASLHRPAPFGFLFFTEQVTEHFQDAETWEQQKACNSTDHWRVCLPYTRVIKGNSKILHGAFSWLYSRRLPFHDSMSRSGGVAVRPVQSVPPPFVSPPQAGLLALGPP